MVKFFKSNLFFFILLFSVVFVVYGKAVNFGLTNLDDDTLTQRKAKHISNLKNIPQFFLTDCYFGKKTQYYRPILTISFSVESFVFGDNLKIYHTTNILLYIIALFIIFIFLSELHFNKTILKFLILIFAVHPILSSVPVWIPARNDTLLTIFFLSSLITFINYIKTNNTKYLIMHFLFFSLALFSKETTVLLILIYPILLYCFNLKTNKKQIIYNFCFLAVLLTVYFILRHYAVRTIDISIYFNNCSYFIKNIIVGTMLYIEKTIYPSTMHIFLYNIKPNTQTYIINLLVLILFIFIYLTQTTNRKKLIFAIFFSFLAILPTFAQEEYAFLTHRIVVSLAGIFIIFTSIIESINTKYPKMTKYLIWIFSFIFLLFSFCSFINIDNYKDEFSFWSKAYKDAPEYDIVYDALAKEYENKKELDIATQFSLQAINLNKCFNNYLTYAVISIAKEDYAEAKNVLLQLLNEDNSNILVYKHLSTISLIEKDYSKATEYAKKALENARFIDDKTTALENLAKIYSVSGNFQEAINTISELLKYDKNNPVYYKLLSMLYEDLNDYDNSVIYIRKALEIEPANEECINQLKNIETKLSTKH